MDLDAPKLHEYSLTIIPSIIIDGFLLAYFRLLKDILRIEVHSLDDLRI
jgi:hypothetical protein